MTSSLPARERERTGFGLLLSILSLLASVAVVEGAARLYLAFHPFGFPPPVESLLPKSPSAYEIPESLSRFPQYPPAFLPTPELQQRSPRAVYTYPNAIFHGVQVPPPNLQHGEEQLLDPDRGTIFHESVNTDDQGRRIPTWRLKHSTPAHFHVAGFGCSFTWGTGVGDDETYLAQLEKRNPELITYNLGYGGYGPNDEIARIGETSVLRDIAPRAGIGIYLWIDAQVPRMFNTTSISAGWGDRYAAVHEESDGSFAYDGPYAEAHPLSHAFQRLWQLSAFARLFHIEFPVLNQDRYDQFGRALAFLGQEYRKATRPENRFVVVLYQGNPAVVRQVRLALDKAKVEFLDYSDVNRAGLVKGPSFILYDGHPTPASYSVLAEAIARDLKLNAK
jgi:hypothetical protein